MLRCGNVYEPHQQPGRSQGVVAPALDCTLRGATIPIYGDGSTVRDYVFVDDVVSVVQRAVDDPSFPNLVNVGTGSHPSRRAVGAGPRGDRLELAEVRPASRSHDISQIVLDIRRLQTAMPSYHRGGSGTVGGDLAGVRRTASRDRWLDSVRCTRHHRDRRL